MDTFTSNRNVQVMWVALGLAFIAGIAYLLIGFNVLAVGSLQTGEKPAGIIYVAAGCYFLGGLLILLRNRWLLLFGVFINAMVMLAFFRMYQGRPDVMFSPGGLVSKLAQILLEVALIYVIVANWKKPK
jgi:hypothetical protein